MDPCEDSQNKGLSLSCTPRLSSNATSFSLAKPVCWAISLMQQAGWVTSLVQSVGWATPLMQPAGWATPLMQPVGWANLCNAASRPSWAYFNISFSPKWCANFKEFHKFSPSHSLSAVCNPEGGVQFGPGLSEADKGQGEVSAQTV